MKEEATARGQTPFGKPANLLLLIEDASKGTFCLSLEDDVTETELGVGGREDARQIPRGSHDRSRARERLRGGLIEEISDFACGESMPGSRLSGSDLEGNLAESINVPGDVGADQLLDHLCGSHGERTSV